MPVVGLEPTRPFEQSILSAPRLPFRHTGALTQMNVQLANVIADVVGETGQKILRAINAGERDGQVLAALKNSRIHASADEIAASLQGNWRAEHLFALKQALAAFDFVGTQLAECDTEIEAQLQVLQTCTGEPAKGKKRGRARNAPKFDLRKQLFQVCGVDLTRIDGIDVTTALAVISETGADMTRFKTAGHFASWLGLCPGTKITGGKIMSSKTKRVANRAAQALRLAAAALRTSQSALGVTAGTARTFPMIVLRHGKAVPRGSWDGPATNTASRSKISTSGSVTSPWTSSGIPIACIRSSAGHRLRKSVTPCALLVVALAG